MEWINIKNKQPPIGVELLLNIVDKETKELIEFALGGIGRKDNKWKVIYGLREVDLESFNDYEVSHWMKIEDPK